MQRIISLSLLYSPKYKTAMGRYREQVIVLDKHPWWHSFLEIHANEINNDNSPINKFPFSCELISVKIWVENDNTNFASTSQLLESIQYLNTKLNTLI